MRGVAESRARRSIAFDRDDKDFSEGFRVFEEPDMAGVQQVETTARTHDSQSGVFPPTPAGNQLSLRNDLSQTYACRALDWERPDL